MTRGARRSLCLVLLVAAGCGEGELTLSEDEISSTEAPLLVAFPGRVGVPRMGNFEVLGEVVPLEYKDVDGFKVFGGDMLLGDEAVPLPPPSGDLLTDEQALAGTVTAANLWK